MLIAFFSTLDGVELAIIIIATFAQALSANGHAVHIIGVLVVWRFIVSTPPQVPNQPSDFIRKDGRWYWRRLPFVRRDLV